MLIRSSTLALPSAPSCMAQGLTSAVYLLETSARRPANKWLGCRRAGADAAMADYFLVGRHRTSATGGCTSRPVLFVEFWAAVLTYAVLLGSGRCAGRTCRQWCRSLLCRGLRAVT
jgi:hypothetical protein